MMVRYTYTKWSDTLIHNGQIHLYIMIGYTYT